METFNFLNDIYKNLYERTCEVCKALKSHSYDISWAYFAFHSTRIEAELMLEYFPVPVITVKNICDIGLRPDNFFIELKFKREEALLFDFSSIKFDFEVYGIENYLNDFYNNSMAVGEIHSNIKKSKEKEIGVQLKIDKTASTGEIIEIVKLCQLWGSHII